MSINIQNNNLILSLTEDMQNDLKNPGEKVKKQILQNILSSQLQKVLHSSITSKSNPHLQIGDDPLPSDPNELMKKLEELIQQLEANPQDISNALALFQFIGEAGSIIDQKGFPADMKNQIEDMLNRFGPLLQQMMSTILLELFYKNPQHMTQAQYEQYMKEQVDKLENEFPGLKNTDIGQSILNYLNGFKTPGNLLAFIESHGTEDSSGKYSPNMDYNTWAMNQRLPWGEAVLNNAWLFNELTQKYYSEMFENLVKQFKESPMVAIMMFIMLAKGDDYSTQINGLGNLAKALAGHTHALAEILQLFSEFNNKGGSVADVKKLVDQIKAEIQEYSTDPRMQSTVAQLKSSLQSILNIKTSGGMTIEQAINGTPAQQAEALTALQTVWSDNSGSAAQTLVQNLQTASSTVTDISSTTNAQANALMQIYNTVNSSVGGIFKDMSSMLSAMVKMQIAN